MEKISTPELAEKSGYLLPNLSVIYGFGVLDLRQEVVVMTMPDSGGLYYMVGTLGHLDRERLRIPAGVEAAYKAGKVAPCSNPGSNFEFANALASVRLQVRN